MESKRFFSWLNWTARPWWFLTLEKPMEFWFKRYMVYQRIGGACFFVVSQGCLLGKAYKGLRRQLGLLYNPYRWSHNHTLRIQTPAKTSRINGQNIPSPGHRIGSGKSRILRTYKRILTNTIRTIEVCSVQLHFDTSQLKRPLLS